MKHNFEELLEQVTKGSNIKTLYAYDVDIGDFCCEDGNPTTKVTFTCEVNRQTGKTTRRILKAIIEASNGNNVFFVTRNMNIASRDCDRIRNVLNGMGVDFWSTQRVTNINGGGRIECLSEERYIRCHEQNTKGIKNSIIIEDLD